VVDAQQGLSDDQVARAADGQKLREPLYEAEQDRFPNGQKRTLLTGEHAARAPRAPPRRRHDSLRAPPLLLPGAGNRGRTLPLLTGRLCPRRPRATVPRGGRTARRGEPSPR